MNYYSFKSIVESGKKQVELPSDADSMSFFEEKVRIEPYIEPKFTKHHFPNEKPSILLVSAMGASGKTTTAHVLSFDTKLPILDLSKHKPVGDNTLTGILTTFYPIECISTVLSSLQTGKHGIIIDGIDEARSKTTKEAFEAFLDDILKLSASSESELTSTIIFGRNQVLTNTWYYLSEKGANVGLIQIEPFGLEQAKSYIDSYVGKENSVQENNYVEARDGLLGNLKNAFHSNNDDEVDPFLSFIGYPPVLDAVSTLLKTEQNYFRINQALLSERGGNLEIDLLIRISDYLLERERKEKALPNIIEPILENIDHSSKDKLKNSLFNKEEQCARILAWFLEQPLNYQVIEDTALNERYEKAIDIWLPEHPFLKGRNFRSAVFASVVVIRCAMSKVSEYRVLANDYMYLETPTYHFLPIMHELNKENTTNLQFFNMLMQSSSDFLALDADILIEMEGDSWIDAELEPEETVELTITAKLPKKEEERAFSFKSNVADAETIELGPYLINSTITVPFEITISDNQALEVIGSCSISAPIVHINAPEIFVQNYKSKLDNENTESILSIDACEVRSKANTVQNTKGKIEIHCNTHNLFHPLAKMVTLVKAEREFKDELLQSKYRRLRRILSEFASHSKGRLAKYRDKIEHRRVLKNEIGEQVLKALLRHNILSADKKFYYVNALECDTKLGIGWHELRQHKTSDKLEEFLKNIK